MYKVGYELKVYTGNDNLTTGGGALGYVFQNVGTVNVFISGYLLKPYDTLDTRQEGEMDVTNWKISFEADVVGTKKLNVLIKSQR